jgi:hypothetical protein
MKCLFQINMTQEASKVVAQGQAHARDCCFSLNHEVLVMEE